MIYDTIFFFYLHIQVHLLYRAKLRNRGWAKREGFRGRFYHPVVREIVTARSIPTKFVSSRGSIARAPRYPIYKDTNLLVHSLHIGDYYYSRVYFVHRRPCRKPGVSIKCFWCNSQATVERHKCTSYPVPISGGRWGGGQGVWETRSHTERPTLHRRCIRCSSEIAQSLLPHAKDETRWWWFLLLLSFFNRHIFEKNYFYVFRETKFRCKISSHWAISAVQWIGV